MVITLGKTGKMVFRAPIFSALPSVMAIALDKVTEKNLFYLFFTFHPNKQKIYITNITNWCHIIVALTCSTTNNTPYQS